MTPGLPESACAHAQRGLLAAVLLIFAPAVAGQQIFKWVDEKGVTQYTTTPPPGGKAQPIRATPASGKAAAEAKSWKDQEIEFRARQVEQAEAENRARRDAALRRDTCADAHRDLQALQQQRPVYALNEKGERQFLDDAQRAEATRKARDFIDRECQR